jgi:hypothetical protein
VDINRVWDAIRENINISAEESKGYYELKEHNPWIEEGYTKLLDQRKQVKLQLQDPSQISDDNRNNVRCDPSRHIRNKKREYFRDKIKCCTAAGNKGKSICRLNYWG